MNLKYSYKRVGRKLKLIIIREKIITVVIMATSIL